MGSAKRGVCYALGAYFLWGVLPVYWKLLQSVPAPTILAHRLLWSFLFLLVVIIVRREWPTLVGAVNRTILPVYLLAAALLAVNWLTYIWAVNADRIVETSLGYFINPLVNVLLAVLFLRERLHPMQWGAVTLAATGVAWLTWQHGSLPWVALVLAGTFGFYALLKKKAPLAPLPGLTLETAVLWLPALIYVAAISARGGLSAGQEDLGTALLLICTGAITALPLLLFAAAARRVQLSTIGLLQYIAPTCQLLIGVLVYGEPFDRVRWIGFGFIWTALALYSIATLRSLGRNSLVTREDQALDLDDPRPGDK
jgi:chloramphenicol-sensitive protein RarD